MKQSFKSNEKYKNQTLGSRHQSSPLCFSYLMRDIHKLVC